MSDAVNPTALTPIPQEQSGGGGMNLWGTDNPELMMQKAARCATVIADVIENRKMFTIIGQGKHVRVEGWQTLGAMVGVFPVVEWTRRLENGWEARVKAVTRNGEVVGAAESQCLNTERNWANKEDHCLRSMAQTRATSKALAMPLRFVIALAGYEGTPAEEMPVGGGAADAAFANAAARKQQSRVQQPGESAAPSQPAAGNAAPAEGLKEWTGKVTRITMREGTNKNNKPYKLYTIFAEGGLEFKSFSDTHAADAKYAQAEGHAVTIKYRESVFKDKLSRDVEQLYPAAEAPDAGAEA